MKITKKQLRQIIKEELGSDPEGEAAYSSQLRKAKSAKKLNTSVEEVEVIADLMANDPEFRMFRNFVDKFKRYSKSGGAVVSSLEAAIPEYVPGKLIMKLVAKAQESLTGDEEPMPKPKSPAASAADMDRWESDYRNENKMKITRERLKQIIKEEFMRESGDPVGPQEAQKVAELLQNLGFTLTRGGMNSLIDLMQGLEQSGDLNATPDSRRGALAEDFEKKLQEGGRLENTAKGAAMALLDAAEAMEQSPSTEPASNYAQEVMKQANLIMDMLVQMEQGQHYPRKRAEQFQENFENDQQLRDSKEDVLRQIVAQGQRAKVQGDMVDLFSAGAIVTVLDALSPENKNKFLDFPPYKMAEIAFKLLK